MVICLSEIREEGEAPHILVDIKDATSKPLKFILLNSSCTLKSPGEAFKTNDVPRASPQRL
jgi:hypothetical protein